MVVVTTSTLAMPRRADVTRLLARRYVDFQFDTPCVWFCVQQTFNSCVRERCQCGLIAARRTGRIRGRAVITGGEE